MAKKKCKQKATPIVITAIMCIAALEAYALYLGHDGLLLCSMVAIIAGLGGLSVPTPKILQR